MKYFGTGLMFAAMAIRIGWWTEPSLAVCALFWAAIISSMFLNGLYLLVPGATCNAIATLANDGAMPVLGKQITSGIHIPLTPETVFPLLCDRYWESSIGDFLLTAAILIVLVLKVISMVAPTQQLRRL